MIGMTTRKTLTEFVKKIEEGHDVCIVPAELLSGVIKQNSTMMEKYMDLQQKREDQLMATLEKQNEIQSKMIISLERLAMSHESKEDNIGLKIDKLTETIN